jgi:hypothetical protein
MSKKKQAHLLRLNNPELNRLFSRVEKTAQAYGWSADQGSADEAEKDQKAFTRARDKFINTVNMALAMSETEVTDVTKQIPLHGQ